MNAASFIFIHVLVVERKVHALRGTCFTGNLNDLPKVCERQDKIFYV